MSKILKIIGFILAIIVSVFLVWVGLTVNQEKIKQCEDYGGIFYNGGWGADNCVFPPKANITQ